jgi:hypothetical protein
MFTWVCPSMLRYPVGTIPSRGPLMSSELRSYLSLAPLPDQAMHEAGEAELDRCSLFDTFTNCPAGVGSNHPTYVDFLFAFGKKKKKKNKKHTHTSNSRGTPEEQADERPLSEEEGRDLLSCLLTPSSEPVFRLQPHQEDLVAKTGATRSPPSASLRAALPP